MTKAEAVEIMDAIANSGIGVPILVREPLMIVAAAVAAKALRRSLKMTKRAKKNAIRRRKEACDVGRQS